MTLLLNLMIARATHFLTVFSIALAVLAAGVLGGNVICVGDDGHVAIESPHKESANRGYPATPPPEHDANHDGSCVDLSADIDFAVRQNHASLPDCSTTLVPPILDAFLPDAVVDIAKHHPIAASISPGLHTAATLGCLRGIVLLM